MNFLDSVKIGEIARLTPEITRSTKQIVFLSGNVMVDDRLVASATGIWKKIL
jgi:acyl-coenzyme A thioesterase PaaI-like protein